MTEQQSINIDAGRLFNLTANLLVAGFIKQPQEQAKKLFKELKQGKSVAAGQLTADQNNLTIPVNIELEKSEFRGQFNYPNFETCLKSLINQFQIKVRQDPELKELSTRANEATGGLLFNIAGATEIAGNLNVLMAAIEPNDNAMVVRLMFFDPDQFVKKDTADEQRS